MKNRNIPIKEKWLYQISNSITNPIHLLRILKLEKHKHLFDGIKAKRLFPFRVPMSFINRMSIGDPDDPLLRQVITNKLEFDMTPGLSFDPLNEHKSPIYGLLHKYKNRVLVVMKNGCSINCRYCFRRYFPYSKISERNTYWSNIINYIKENPVINEIILSGGDPLMIKDHELEKIVFMLEKIQHLSILRIHSRMITIIPDRITKKLCQILSSSRLQTVIVTHVNHPKEIDNSIYRKIKLLKRSNTTLLNQSVLLHKVNDDPDVLVDLSNKLFSIGILPYYLHFLDKTQGTKHFMISIIKAKRIAKELSKRVSGYLLPRLVKDIPGKLYKIPIHLDD